MAVRSGLTAAVLFLVTSAFSQSTGPSDGSRPSESAQLHLLDGVAVSYLAPESEHSSFRFTALVDLRSGTLSGSREIRERFQGFVSGLDTTDIEVSPSRFDDHAYTLGFAASLIRHYTLTDEVELFVGIGPMIRYARTYVRESWILPDYPYSLNRRIKSDEWGAGALGTLGFQVFLTPSVGLLAEYRPSVLRIWKTETSRDPSQEVKLTATGLDLDLRSITFGLGFHF